MNGCDLEQGTPLRIEVGPKDVENGVVTVKSRIENDREQWSNSSDEVVEKVEEKLEGIQSQLYETALERTKAFTHRTSSYEELKSRLAESEESSPVGCFLVPWYDDADAEAAIKEETKATIRCFPVEWQHEKEGQTCFYSGKPATHMALFGRAY